MLEHDGGGCVGDVAGNHKALPAHPPPARPYGPPGLLPHFLASVDAYWLPITVILSVAKDLALALLVILSVARDLVLIGHGHAPCHSSLKSLQSGLIDSIKATFFA